MESGHNEVQSTSRDTLDLATQIPTHFLVELTSLDELSFPANSTKRVKYTCVASTSKSLCLGTSTGSVYIFSRYAAKSRSRTSSPVPVQVFTTRDGQISTIAISPSEEMMAIGGDSGRVSVAQMNNGQPPTLLYSTPGDARSPDKVTALSWCADLKTVYSGHSSGALHVHRLTNRSVFRATHQRLNKFAAEITQLDTFQEHVLVATSLAAHLYHVEKGTVQQVGTKPRTSPANLGACYVTPSVESAYIVAARPNGRLWEANLVGHVYRTHQYRQTSRIARSPPVSFRSSFPTDPSQFDGIHPDNQDVMLNLIQLLQIDGHTMVLSTFGSRICIVETDTSHVICVAELEHEILDVSTCGNDVFVLLADSKGLRKFSVFDRMKTVEKLHLKSLYLQSAQFILFCSPHVQFPSPLITKTVEGLANMSKKKETERLQQSLQKIIDERKASQSMYDNLEGRNEVIVSKKLPSGVYRVLQTGQCSGYDDDFSFHAPQALRERSRSSPCGPEPPLSPAAIAKRASEPSNLEIRQEWRKNGTPDVAEEDILYRARQILDSADGKVMEKESLRTLLQLEGIKKDEIRFTPTVTIGNAAKALAELALAVPFDLSTIWKNEIIPEEDEEQEALQPFEKAKKPTIVKVVRPGIRPGSATRKKDKPVATVSPNSFEKSEDVEANILPPESTERDREIVTISDEMRRKQDEMWLDLRLSHIKKQTDRSTSSSSEAVPKSDTDYTLTTLSGDPTPQEEVWTNPLGEEDIEEEEDVENLKTPTSSIASFSCSSCRMHRSWAAASLLLSVCGKADVLKDEFSRNGALPATMNDWQRLLRHVASFEGARDLSAICPSCEMSLSTVERVCNDGWKTVGGIVEEGTKANKERIFERCQNSAKEKLRTIVSRSPVPSEQKRTAALENQNNQEKSENNLESSSEDVPLNPDHWNWTSATSLRTILALAVFFIGKKSVMQIIACDDQWIAKRMTPSDWCAVVVMGTREVRFKDLLSAKTIASIFDSAGASGWVAPRKAGPSQPLKLSASRKMSPSSSSSFNITSWIVDTNGKCPICTLSIRMIVGGSDRGVVSYCCGHVYHKVCLAGRYTIGCLACRVRARRAARIPSATSSAAASPTASPVQSPRHQHVVR